MCEYLRGLGNRWSLQLSYGGVTELSRTDEQIGSGGTTLLGAISYPQHPPAKTCRWQWAFQQAGQSRTVE